MFVGILMLDTDGNVVVFCERFIYKKLYSDHHVPFSLWHSELWWASVVKQQQQRRRYLDASGISLLNQRPTATSTLSTNVTPISRDTLLTTNPEASNINLEGENRQLCDGGWEI